VSFNNDGLLLVLFRAIYSRNTVPMSNDNMKNQIFMVFSEPKCLRTIVNSVALQLNIVRRFYIVVH